MVEEFNPNVIPNSNSSSDQEYNERIKGITDMSIKYSQGIYEQQRLRSGMSRYNESVGNLIKLNTHDDGMSKNPYTYYTYYNTPTENELKETSRKFSLQGSINESTSTNKMMEDTCNTLDLQIDQGEGTIPTGSFPKSQNKKSKNQVRTVDDNKHVSPNIANHIQDIKNRIHDEECKEHVIKKGLWTPPSVLNVFKKTTPFYFDDFIKERPKEINDQEECVILMNELADAYATEECRLLIPYFDIKNHNNEYQECYKKHLKLINKFKVSKNG